jgi:thiol-disulfide isomerase/thioredoxin
MKNILILFFFLFSSSLLFSQDDEHQTGAGGMQFFEGSWSDVLAAAKEQNKYIFVDAFADWCVPCKWMASNVFPKEEAGKFYNEHFVIYKFDMEKGEGIDFAKKYEVSVYPTYLFFNPEGELVHRSVGSKPLEMFIEDGKNALSPEKQFLSMKKKYENGERGEEFLYNYAFALFNANADPETINEVAVAYLSTQKEDDYISEKNWKVMDQLVTDVNSAPFKYLEANKDEFTAKYGEKDVDMKISYSKMEYYSLNKQWNDYAKVVSGIADKYASDDWQMLNGFAWTFYENISDKSMLKKAAKWAKKSMSLDKNYYNTDTYASLLYKLGKYDDALKYAKEALELAKKSNENYSGTEELIKKIEKAK